MKRKTMIAIAACTTLFVTNSAARPCNEIHTFCMKFAIDAVYLDKNDCIVFIEEAIAPGKICKLQRKAKKVLELCPNVSSKIGLAPGDKLTFEIN